MQVYSTYRFNYRLLFEERLTSICLALQILKQINREIPTQFVIARKESL